MKYTNFQYSGKRHIYLVRVFVYYVENYNYCNIVNYFPVVENQGKHLKYIGSNDNIKGMQSPHNSVFKFFLP